MANDKNFLIKNGLQAGRYLQTGGTETAGSVGYSLAGASYDSVSFSVASQDSNTTNSFFKTDGTKMYVVGLTNDSVYQYSLSTAWDLSTASYDSVSLSVAAQDTTPFGVFFKTDGTKMYLVGFSNARVYQYSLSTAWDLSTASYDSVSFSVAAQEATPTDVYFKPDGAKMYVAGQTSDSVYQYSLSTAWDISTASYDSASLDASSQGPFPYGIFFNSDGANVYIAEAGADNINQYSLSTAWDISTASYNNISFSVSPEGGSSSSVFFKPDGTKMYVNNAGTIYQYSTVGNTQTLDLSTGNTFSFTPSGATTVSFTNAPASGKAVGFAVEINGDGSAITWPSSVKWDSGTTPTATASKELYAFVTTDGGTTYYGRKAAEELA